MILPRHLVKIVGGRVLAALVVLVAVLQILDLLDVTTDILQRKLGAGGVVYYATLRLPLLIEQVAPVSVLAGCLFAFAQLARENAVVALRSTGMSVYRLVALAAPAVLAVVVLHLLAAQWLSPHSEQVLDSWWRSTAPAGEASDSGQRSFRVGEDVVLANLGAENGRRLTHVTLYRRDASGRLVERIRASEARFDGQAWRLQNPTVEAIGAADVQQAAAADMVWRSGPAPEDVRSVFSNDGDVAPGSARRALAGGVAAYAPSVYRTALAQSWSAPVEGLVMLLLAAPVMLVNFRSGGATTVVSCLAAGLLFLVMNGVFQAMGEGGQIPALLAAWGAPVIFAAAGAAALVYLEG